MYAIAQISKIMGLHRSTDKFGPIPYKQVGNGSFTVEYDSQESVYRSFFEELDEAVTVLYDFYMKANNTVPMASDVVYDQVDTFGQLTDVATCYPCTLC